MGTAQEAGRIEPSALAALVAEQPARQFAAAETRRATKTRGFKRDTAVASAVAQLGCAEEKARYLLQHGSPAEIRAFLESIPGTPENLASAKRAQFEMVQRQIQRKRKARMRRISKKQRAARKKNRGLK
jgi:hypothetical protein